MLNEFVTMYARPQYESSFSLSLIACHSMMNRLFALDQRTSASDNDQCEPAGNGAASLHPRVQPVQSHQSHGAAAKANAGGEETGHHGSTHPPRFPAIFAHQSAARQPVAEDLAAHPSIAQTRGAKRTPGSYHHRLLSGVTHEQPRWHHACYASKQGRCTLPLRPEALQRQPGT